MKKTKILIPLDVSEMSMNPINWIKKHFDKNDIEITLMNASEKIVADDAGDFQKRSKIVLNEVSMKLEGYTVERFLAVGYIPDEILKKAEEGNYDIIIMEKSSKTRLLRIIGSVTTKVLKNAKIPVIVLPQ
ncbi:universal stress protein [Clostridium sp.]|uniref:universal stress protein n=1 Tax=Clostridium sp. TaxID=1506 RepID=UPI00284FF93F|nr:universal stress protein [Clostridium sp.]MDR3596885.1 universal stress protein [Clostridium sp.]